MEPTENSILEEYRETLDAAPTARERLIQFTQQEINGSIRDSDPRCYDIIAAHVAELAKDQAAAVALGDFHLAYKHIDRFRANVLRAMEYERSNGRLKKVRKADVLTKNRDDLNAKCWRSAELGALNEDDQLMPPGSDIAAIDFDTIALTSGKVIRRGEVRAAARPETRKNLVPDDVVAETRNAVKMTRPSQTGVMTDRGFVPHHPSVPVE